MITSSGRKRGGGNILGRAEEEARVNRGKSGILGNSSDLWEDGGSGDVHPDKYNSVTGIKLKVAALYHTQREKYILQK